MLWVLIFLALAIIFAGVGFGLAVAGIKILFYIFVVLFILSLIAKMARRV